jgi:hypothetical protein
MARLILRTLERLTAPGRPLTHVGGNGPIWWIEAIRDANRTQSRSRDRSHLRSGTNPFAMPDVGSKPLSRRNGPILGGGGANGATFRADRTQFRGQAPDRSPSSGRIEANLLDRSGVESASQSSRSERVRPIREMPVDEWRGLARFHRQGFPIPPTRMVEATLAGGKGFDRIRHASGGPLLAMRTARWVSARGLLSDAA